jgi:hypothetical protein
MCTHKDEPLADWERELLTGDRKTVTVRLTVTHLDGSTTVIDGINCESFVWVHLNTETNGPWRNDAPLTLSVQSETEEGLIYYVPNVKFYTTESIEEWVKA